jgi:hypothetical protein
LNSRQQKPDEHPNDRNHNKQFYEREAGMRPLRLAAQRSWLGRAQGLRSLGPKPTGE